MPMILDGSNGLTMPTWTTTNRPISPIIGAQGYNTTYGGVEVYNGSAWDLITGGPAFYADMGSSQTLSTSSYTKIQMNTKVFDTNNCYDASTNYRFTPTVPGYYLVTIQIFWVSTVVSPSNAVYKNGSLYSSRYDQGTFTNLMQGHIVLMYLNGTTDYIENYAQISSGSTGTYTGTGSSFQAVYVRGQ
jgi:hypothetical protein